MTRASEDAGRPIRFDAAALLATVLLVGLLWAYWPTLREMVQTWSTDPRYAHGYLVPVFALVLLWIRREHFEKLERRPSGGGLILIGAALALKSAGAYFYLGWFEAVSLLPALAGLCVLVWGWQSLRWSWPAIVFLVFMIPLPFRLAGAMAFPLQRVATKASTYALQTLGYPALAEGNIIHLNDVEIGVVEACSGLSMLFTFFAMATGMVLVIRRPLLDNVLIIASAFPISLLVNVIRITVTGILHEAVSSRVANIVFHGFAGLLMMPMALILLWLELELLDRLLIKPGPEDVAPKPFDLVGATVPLRDRGEPGERRPRDDNPNPPASALKQMLRNP